MKKFLKKLVCFALAFVFTFGTMPAEASALEENEEIEEDTLQQALFLIPEEYPDIDFLGEHTVPEAVTVEEASARLEKFIEMFEGKFFTVDGNYCKASGVHASSCDNCLMSNVIAEKWVQELVGMGTLDASLCPTQYSYKGTQGSADGWQCFGFANFAHWYIFAGKNTDKVTSTLEKTGPLTYETIKNALPGDVLRSNYYGGHSMIFISCDETGFNVIDSNHTGNADGKSACIVKVHKVKYNASYTVAITGTTNYDRTVECEHEYKGVLCSLCGEKHPNATNYEGKVISILGDSISTFKGYVPVADGFNEEHPYTYPANTVDSWDKTWWGQVINDLNAKLGINDSWSGSRVQNTYTEENPGGNVGTKVCFPSITRVSNLGTNGTPDVILVYGGTNDGKFSKFGEFNSNLDYSNVNLDAVTWSTFEEAYVAMIMRLKYYYPKAQIIALLPTHVTSWYTDEKLEIMNSSIKQICEYFDVPYVDLPECGITTENLPDGLHPNAEGMDYITDAVLKVLLEECEIDDGENIVYSVTHYLDGAKASNGHYKGVSKGMFFKEILTGDFECVSVIMGGSNITESCYKDGTIEIKNVTGNIVIKATKHNFENGVCTICGTWEYSMGDLNLDGVVDVMDAYTARLISAKLIKPTEQQILVGDVDGDGKITAVDANYIRKFVAYIIDKFPVEK